MTGGPAIVHDGNANIEQFLDKRKKWYRNKRLVLLNAWIFLMLLTSSTNGYDGSMMNGLQSLDQWRGYFHNPQGGTLGLFNAIQNIGSLAAYPFAPFLSDGLGRRRTIFIGAVIMCGAAALQAAAQSFGMFIGARFLIGFGAGIAGNSAPLLITEIAYPSHRAPLTSLYNSVWQFGAFIAAWTTFGTFKIPSSLSWRIPSAIQGLPSVFQVCLILFGPESPRWLVNRGREADALRTLAYYHADGDEDHPLVRYELEEIKAAIEFDKTVAANVGYKSLFTSPGNRKRMRIVIALAFFSQWSGNGLVSYYLNKVFDTIGIKSPTIQLLINGILQIWNSFWTIFASFLVDRAGRRVLFLTSAAGMFFAFLFQTVCTAQFALHESQAAAHAVIAFIFLFYGFYDLAFSPLIVSYTVEILPYPLRAKGLTVFSFALSLSLIFNQYVNPIALKHLGWKYYIVYVVWIVFEFVYCYLFVVETKNRTLEETAALFDGEQAMARISGRAADELMVDEQEDKDTYTSPVDGGDKV
ncbi:hexose transporter [Punctularia strigosozonata HHB-11173 SS5]|uniref:hexose transporter n=1 Tax=Punctularia strigosozonata (strain HHB-11173) TaxID=741275 RepID=UPI000441636E|nr:hexose transporter [Punctularia strigosozonata HHB-11173 SS5]EIN08369.1 hexose transporter [Punctularia strigosozonata HHB-11173 SS5]